MNLNIKLAIQTCLTLSCSAVAHADDWAGNYYSVGLGFGTNATEHHYIPTNSDAAVNASGQLVKLAYGKNYQSNSIVYGFELGAAIANISGKLDDSGTAPCVLTSVGNTHSCENTLKNLVSASVRVGSKLSDDFFLYGKLTGAYGKVRLTVDSTSFVDNIPSGNACGRTLCGGPDFSFFGLGFGLGIEKKLANGNRLQFEVNHIDFGSQAIGADSVVNDLAYTVATISYVMSF